MRIIVYFLFWVIITLSITACESDKKKQFMIKDSMDKYNQAVASGDLMQICINAGIVKAVFEHLKDQENYLKWTNIKNEQCGQVGL